MRNIDVEQQVMQKVIRLERRRTRWWLFTFWVFLGTLSTIIAISILAIAIALREKNSLLVLSIFGDGWSAIRDGWFDALRSIWYDIPRHHLVPALCAILVLAIIIFFTRRSRARIRRQRASIAAYTGDQLKPRP